MGNMSQWIPVALALVAAGFGGYVWGYVSGWIDGSSDKTITVRIVCAPPEGGQE